MDCVCHAAAPPPPKQFFCYGTNGTTTSQSTNQVLFVMHFCKRFLTEAENYLFSNLKENKVFWVGVKKKAVWGEQLGGKLGYFLTEGEEARCQNGSNCNLTGSE